MQIAQGRETHMMSSERELSLVSSPYRFSATIPFCSFFDPRLAALVGVVPIFTITRCDIDNELGELRWIARTLGAALGHSMASGCKENTPV